MVKENLFNAIYDSRASFLSHNCSSSTILICQPQIILFPLHFGEYRQIKAKYINCIDVVRKVKWSGFCVFVQANISISRNYLNLKAYYL